MRSRTGCLTCRQRKLKCDEKKPSCGQCKKASRDCIPSSGIVFRHQHNASMNGEDSSDENGLKGFYAYKNTFDEGSIWLDVPRQVTFLNTTNPYLDPLTPDFDNLSTTSVDSPAPFEPRSTPAWATSRRSRSNASTTSCPNGYDSYPSPGNGLPLDCMSPEPAPRSDPLSHMKRNFVPLSPTASVASSPEPVSAHNFGYMLGHATVSSPPIDPCLSSSFEIMDTSGHRASSASLQLPVQAPTDPYIQQDHEIAFLLRHFSQGPGYWMDLFDLGTYFSSYVPVRARENPLLKYAAVAYAAKALGRVQGKMPTMGGIVSQQARMEFYPDIQSVDWYHKAAQYYDTAVSLLRQTLQDDANSLTPMSESDNEQSWHNTCASEQDDGSRKRRRVSSNGVFKSSSDELLAATAILCVYEFLDASVPEWARHLNGAKSLLQIAQERIMPFQMPSPNTPVVSSSFGHISKARRATFWNIARQDMLAAFINKTHTRLDTEDLPLWKEAGLLLDDQGFVVPSNTTDTGYPEGDGMMKEDMICNALVWLMAKLVNFMAAGDDMPTGLGGPWAGVPQRTLLDYWYSLKQQFHTWYEGLPSTFKACARVDPTQKPGQMAHGRNSMLFHEIWFSIPMCASTMQAYHMSQIQLLMNKPHESTQGRTTVVARLNSYKSVLAACQVHSREIIGIALGRPDESVRIHSTQALFTAGQVCDSKARQLVVKLLRDIEADTGWATDYRVQQLVQQWQWEENEDLHVS